MPVAPWILLLYNLPTDRGSARVGLWRKLKRSGALPFKTSAYLLPNRPDLLERFQWLAQQVQDAGGDASLLLVSELEGVSREDIERQFHETRATDYEVLANELNAVIENRPQKPDDGYLQGLEKLRKRYQEIRQIDFFDSPAAAKVAMQLERASNLTDGGEEKQGALLSAGDYADKVWLTRPRPAIDRVGTAWLISRHIDSNARYVFASDPATHPEAIPFDMTGVEFTHHGDDCTFETFLKRFGLEDPALGRIGQMIHDADLDDGKFQTCEAFGLDRVFKGWARLGVSDDEILTRGYSCFDALYAFLDNPNHKNK